MASIYLRGNVYWISYYHYGRLIQRSLRVKDKRIALHLKREKEIELERGTAALPSTKPVDEFFDEYKAYAATRKTKPVFDQETGRLTRFFREMSPRRLNDITANMIHKFIVSISSELSPRTVNHYLKHIRCFLGYAVAVGYLPENPAKGIPRMKVETGPPEFLSKEEVSRLLDAAKTSRLYHMILTALYTGMRVGELMRLKWPDIDTEMGVITVRRAKSGTFRVIPLNSQLKAKLGHSGAKNGHCFTYHGNPYAQKPRKELQSVYKAAGLECRGWHILRKTYASHLVMQGISLAKVSKWLGHADPRLTYQTYAHLSPQTDSDIESLTF